MLYASEIREGGHYIPHFTINLLEKQRCCSSREECGSGSEMVVAGGSASAEWGAYNLLCEVGDDEKLLIVHNLGEHLQQYPWCDVH